MNRSWWFNLLLVSAGLRPAPAAEPLTNDVAHAALREEVEALAAEKETAAVRSANEVRARYGLGPLNTQFLTPSGFGARWADWLGARRELEAVTARLQTARAMTARERDIAARLYVPHVVISPHPADAKHNGAWLLGAIQAEYEVAQAKVRALREALGITRPDVTLDEAAIREIEEADGLVLRQRRVKQRMIEELGRK